MATRPDALPVAQEPSERLGSGFWTLVATIVGSSMAFIDGTVVNVALPALQRDLRATLSDIQWVVEAYALLISALILLGGSLGDLFGRRRIFALGVLLFTAASVWCGLAADAGGLIMARAFQGVGGALLVPNSLAIVNASFTGAQRGRAIGIWSAFTAITTALGPVLGGWMVEHLSWRWVFFLNLPLAVVTLLILFLRVAESRSEGGPRLVDWPGALLAALGLGGLVFGLIESANRGLSDPLVLGSLLGSLLALAGFLLVEARSPAPMMPLWLFHSRDFNGTNLLTLLLYAALGGALFLLPLNLIQVQGYSVTAAGAAMLPMILIIFALAGWGGELEARYGARLLLVIGPAVAALGYALAMLPGVGGSYWATFFPPVAVVGLGMGITVTPLTTTVMGAVDVRHSGVASGINTAVSRVAGLLAVAVLGVVVLASFNSGLDQRIGPLGLAPAQRQELDAQRARMLDATLPADLSAAQRTALERAMAASFVDGFRNAMGIAAGLALGSALCAATMIGRREAPPGAGG